MGISISKLLLQIKPKLVVHYRYFLLKLLLQILALEAFIANQTEACGKLQMLKHKYMPQKYIFDITTSSTIFAW
mgnify:FL=1